MGLADQILEKITCDEVFQIIGDLDAEDILAAFEARLVKMDLPDVTVAVAIDDSEGIFVRFEDTEGDDVLLLFGFDEIDDDPIASVVSDEDEQVTIDLTALSPTIIDVSGMFFIDLLDLSWLKDSALRLLLNAGQVGPNTKVEKPAPTEQPLENKAVMVGNRKFKSPIVKTRPTMTDKEKRQLQMAKDNGMIE